MLKILGIILIFVSASAIGFQMSYNMKKRIRLIREIKYVLEEIINEAIFGRDILYNILTNVSEKTDGICKKWLFCICDDFRMNEGTDFKRAWFTSMQYLKTYGLKNEDIDIISNFGERIVNLNEDRLSSISMEYIKRVDEHIDELNAEYAVKSRLYKSMGVLAGLSIIIIVI